MGYPKSVASRRDASTKWVIVIPSTFVSLHDHIVFSTKHRDTAIDLAWCERLHEYLGRTVRSFREEWVDLLRLAGIDGASLDIWVDAAAIPPGWWGVGGVPVVSLRSTTG